MTLTRVHESISLQEQFMGIREFVVDAWSRSWLKQRLYCEALIPHLKKWDTIQRSAFSFTLEKDHLLWGRRPMRTGQTEGLGDKQ